MELFFTVDREAIGKGRPRWFNGRAVTPEKTRNFEGQVRMKSKLAMNFAGLKATVNPVRVKIQAFYQVPKSRTKSFKRIVDEKLVPYDKKPDADNVAKAICDAMNGIVYADDKQVFSVVCEQFYMNSDSHFTVFVSDEIAPISGTDQGKSLNRRGNLELLTQGEDHGSKSAPFRSRRSELADFVRSDRSE